MRIKSVALIGAGAVGSWFIPGLSFVFGDHFCVIAEGERAERLKRDGIRINGKPYRLNVKTAVEAGSAGIDLVLVTVKYNALPEVIPELRTILQLGKILSRDLADPSGTIIMSPLNGVDSEEIIAEEIGQEHMLYSFMRVVAHRDGNAVAVVPSGEGLIFGEKDTEEKTERCAAVETMLGQCGIAGRFSGDIMTEMWQKFALNIANNLPQAILGAGYGAFLDSEHLAYIRDCLAFETIAVARKHDIVLTYEPNTRDKALPQARFSTLQDLDAGRHTEVDMLAGVLLKKAVEADIPVPFTEYTYHMIKALEEKNDGRFDYDVR